MFTLAQVVPWGRSFDEYCRMFDLSGDDLGLRILRCGEATFDQILGQAQENADEFVWDSIRSVENLGRIRMTAMEAFLHDYDGGAANGRYLAAELPALPFVDASFDLALCSHLLFLYSAQLDEGFHVDAIQELCRIAGEVRIFPILALGGQRSPYVDRCQAQLRQAGHEVTIERVPYEFQRGGNEMMRIRTKGAVDA